ncbi:MAG: hypothetical protein M3305_06805 [Actinomycetota bacterium]|nr:hypothetical protein [Actinomycetota bacterium]
MRSEPASAPAATLAVTGPSQGVLPKEGTHGSERGPASLAASREALLLERLLREDLLDYGEYIPLLQLDLSLQQLAYVPKSLRPDLALAELVAELYEEAPDPGVLEKHLHHLLLVRKVAPMPSQHGEKRLFLLAEVSAYTPSKLQNRASCGSVPC